MEKKSAEERVLALITGVKIVSSDEQRIVENDFRNKIIASTKDTANKDSIFSHSVPLVPFVPSVDFAPLPLPSEILSRQSNLDCRYKENNTSAKPEIMSSMALSNKKRDDVSFKTEDKVVRHSSRSRKQFESSNTRTAVGSGNISFNNVPAVGAAMDVVNQKFGSMFIVAATEKKKRFTVTKKPSQQSIDETKKNDKIERRRQAMQRLLKRQEERKAFLANKRLEREESRRIKAATISISIVNSSNATSEHSTPLKEIPSSSHSISMRSDFGNVLKKSTSHKVTPPLPNNNDSSDTESISGGDDDLDIANAINEQLVNVVNTVVPPRKKTAATKIEDNKNRFVKDSTTTMVNNNSNKSVENKATRKEKFLQTDKNIVVIPKVQINETIIEVSKDVANEENLEAVIAAKNLAALQSLRRLKESKRETSRSSSNLSFTNENATDIEKSETSSASEPVRAQSASASFSNSKVMSPRTSLLTSRSVNDPVELPLCVSEPTSDRTVRLQIVEHVENGLVTYMLSIPRAIIPAIEAWEDVTAISSPSLELKNCIWSVNMDTYIHAVGLLLVTDDGSSLASDENNTKFSYFGLVLLTKYLLHAFPSLTEVSDYNADIFITIWLECLYRFDDRVDIWLLNSRFQRDFDDNVESYSRMNPVTVGSTLLREVSVCQGLFEACEKLHKVLLYHSLKMVRYKYLHCFSSTDDLVDAIDDNMASVIKAEEKDVNTSLIHTDDDASIQYGAELAGNNGDDEDNGDCVGSDDESILPIYDNFTKPLVESGSVAIVDNSETNKVLTGMENSTEVSVRPKLSDIYTNIGMIFPVAYNQYGLSKQHNDSSASARSLLESMHVQAKVYDEWVEVMSDYSTVFSEEREIREHSISGRYC